MKKEDRPVYMFQRINHLKVTKIIPLQEGDGRPFKGAELFSVMDANIFIPAKKGYGKTTVIGYILKKCSGRNTIIIIFCSTVNMDPSWLAIQKYFKDRGQTVLVHDSIVNDETKEDQLKSIMKAVKFKARMAQQKAQPRPPENKQPGYHVPKLRFSNFRSAVPTKPEAPKPKPSKYKSPDIIFVLDDISDEAKRPSVVKLMKENRHLRSMTILGTQDVKDILPSQRKMAGYILLFKDMTTDRLYNIWESASIKIPFTEFEAIYKKATEGDHNFLYIDCYTNSFRRNFNEKIILPHMDKKIV